MTNAILVDSHTHVSVRALLARTIAAIQRDFPVLPIEDLLSQMKRHRVKYGVLVQWGGSFDHHYLARCLKDHPGRFAGVCEVDVTRGDALEALEGLVENGFQGIRLQTTDRSPGRRPMAIWDKAFELGLAVSACARSSEESAAGLRPVLRRLPQLRVRIEHLARPPYHRARPHPDFDKVMRLAGFANVYFSIDGFYAHHYPKDRDFTTLRFTTYPFPEYMPFVRQAIESFGCERCMWGSEFPLNNNGYDVGLRFIREACDFLSAKQREWILGRAAMAFWRFGT